MVSNYSESIVEKILFEPIRSGADRLCILSANATPSMASWLMTTYAEEIWVKYPLNLSWNLWLITELIRYHMKDLKNCKGTLRLAAIDFPAVIFSSHLRRKRIILYG